MMYYHALTDVIRQWQLTEHVSYLMYIFSSSDRCHETKKTDGACFIHEEYITMLWPLSCDDDNWWSMFHACMIYYNALTVVIRRWHLTEHVSYLTDTSPCSESCHETIANDRAWFIPYACITMLWPLLWDDDSWRSMFYTWGIYYHALTVVMWQWQLTKHGRTLDLGLSVSLVLALAVSLSITLQSSALYDYKLLMDASKKSVMIVWWTLEHCLLREEMCFSHTMLHVIWIASASHIFFTALTWAGTFSFKKHDETWLCQ